MINAFLTDLTAASATPIMRRKELSVYWPSSNWTRNKKISGSKPTITYCATNSSGHISIFEQDYIVCGQTSNWHLNIMTKRIFFLFWQIFCICWSNLFRKISNPLGFVTCSLFCINLLTPSSHLFILGKYTLSWDRCLDQNCWYFL